MKNIIKCCCCGRQIVSYPANDDRVVGGGPVTHMGIGEYACYMCAAGLDENGNFPEEVLMLKNSK